MKKLSLLLCLLTPFLASTQIITTVAGSNIAGYEGDSGPATDAKLKYPRAVAMDGAGGFYIAESSNNVIRKVSASGIITTIAGTGTAGYSGDGGAATAAELNSPWEVKLDHAGNIYISDAGNNVVRKTNAAGVISTIAGNGFGAGTSTGGYTGDGGAATAAEMYIPIGLAIDTGGNVFVSDQKNHAVRKISPTGIISTIAGTGINGYSGDGGAATAAQLNLPSGLALGKNNELYICDFLNNVVRKIGSGGIISTFVGNGYMAGTGSGGFSGDGGAATAAELAHPYGIVMDTLNNIYFSDLSSFHVRKVDSAGVLHTIAGDGSYGYSGDGGPAITAQLSFPYGLALTPTGELFIADAFNHIVRKISVPVRAAVSELEPSATEIHVFPNPACNTLHISSQLLITSVVIYNVSGVVAFKYQYNAKEVSIDISKLPAGVYLVSVNGMVAKEFVK